VATTVSTGPIPPTIDPGSYPRAVPQAAVTENPLDHVMGAEMNEGTCLLFQRCLWYNDPRAASGREWSTSLNPMVMRFEAALNETSELSIGGLGGWRLAAKAERETIIDRRALVKDLPSYPERSR
jgi:hypothetical protein